MSNSKDFVISGGTLEKYKGPGGHVDVPESVTSIGGGAFSRCSSLKSITLPEGVTSIGNAAFWGCSSLTSITLLGSVTSIGEVAFYDCCRLTSITLPEGLTSIGEKAFSDCNSLTSITLPEGVTHIGSEAFKGCSSLTSITLPDSVTSIVSGAFSGCSSLTSITLPESVTSIGEGAFEGCDRLIEKRNEIDYVDTWVIDADKGITTAVLEVGTRGIAFGAFSDCRSLTSITLPEGVTSIGKCAFSSCSSLTSITLPDGVTSIGERAFHGCSSLTSITLPESVTSIGKCAFSSCSSLTSITLPEGLTSIGESAFWSCSSLTSITLPEGVTSIGWAAFKGCSSLTSITLPNSVTSIGWEDFSGCSSLTSITLPESVTSIGRATFECCSSLTSITLPEGVTSIGKGAFKGCSSLTSLILPEGLTAIGDSAFQGCSSLTSLILPEGLTAIGDSAFQGCSSLTSLILPEGLTAIGDSAFQGCSSLKSITLPEGLTSVGKYGFIGCRSLTSLTLPSELMLEANMFDREFPPVFLNQFQEISPHLENGLLYTAVSDPRLWNRTPIDYMTDVFLSKQAKAVLTSYRKGIQDPAPLGKEILKRLNAKSSAKVCNAAATFMILFTKDVDASVLQDLYSQLRGIKAAQKALEKIRADKPLMEKLGSAGKIIQDLPPAEQIITEYMPKGNSTFAALEVRFQDYYSKIELPTIRYKDGSVASPRVLQWLLTVHEKKPSEPHSEDIIPAYKEPGVCREASEVVKELDAAGFQAALRRLAALHLGIEGRNRRNSLAYPICRYADEALMADLTKEAPHWRSVVSGNDAPPLKTFRKACLYSNTRAAMLSADKFHDLEDYAMLRKTDADTIRDQYLSDVGINERGEKAYDLGNQIVTAALQPDLSFLILKADGKIAKSLPKKDADLKKYAAANDDFSEMKKAAKKIVKNRRSILFEEFLSGRARNADGWKRAYLQNPLLRSVAKLLVWQQGDSTFTLDGSGAIQADGAAYEINNAPISVAHPMKMKPEHVSAWQKYFTSQGLKQPFAQVWEPVIDPAGVKKERYKDCMIPYYRFRSMEKHGINVDNDIADHYVYIDFKDCWTRIDRIDYSPFELNNDDRFEVTSFSFMKYTRYSNHIAAYLDRITVYDRILKDDVTVETFLPTFTLAQITEFIKLASENNCTNVTALLLNYKNEHFADFDPMEEFTLGEL